MTTARNSYAVVSQISLDFSVFSSLSPSVKQTLDGGGGGGRSCLWKEIMGMKEILPSSLKELQNKTSIY